MNPLNLLFNQFMQGQLANHPLMPSIQQMINGKTPQQQMETLLNVAKSRGFDINAKIFSESDLRSLGLR